MKIYKIGLIFILCFTGRLNLSQAQNSVESTLNNVQNQLSRAVPIGQPSPNPSPYSNNPTSIPIPPPSTTSAAGGPPVTVTPARTTTTGGPMGNNSTSPNVGGTINGVNPGAAGAAIDPASLGSLASKAKYAEFQSICRSHEYDKIKFQSAEIQKDHLAELKLQLAASEDSGPEAKLAVLKEFLEFGDIPTFNAEVRKLKMGKLANKENEMLNALLALSSRSYQNARLALLKVNEIDKKNIFTLKTLGEVYYAEENYFEAITIYEDLNRISKDAYLVELCEVMVMHSLNAEGEEVCLLAANKFRDNPFPHIYAGITHRERESHKRATALFKKSLAIKPTEMGNICLAEMSLIADKPEEAAEFFKQSLEQSPYSVRAVLGLAWSELKAKNYPGALTAFKKACKINRRFEVEVRKAYKTLTEDKVPNSRQFLQLAETCGL